MIHYRIICVPSLPADGMALFPFILVKKREYKKDLHLLNHERIHLAQQVELLILPFYILYLINYLINLCFYKNHRKAYMNIIFEKEAYAMERTSDYLPKRKYSAWMKFVK